MNESLVFRDQPCHAPRVMLLYDNIDNSNNAPHTSELRELLEYSEGKRYSSYLYKNDLVERGSSRFDFEYWLKHLWNFRCIAVELAKDPILVGSGQYEPQYGPVRTYADVQNEIASMLANLPHYQARCKFGEHEYTIKTLRPQSQVNPANVSLIRKLSQRDYCGLRTEVEGEIRGRKALPLEQGGILPPPAHADDIPSNRPQADDEENLSDERAW